MIELRGISKSYHQGKRVVQALDDVSLLAKEGKITALIGPNGSGKTTLMRLLSTLLNADRGEIRVAGYDVINDSEIVRGKLGFLTGGARLHRKLSAIETLEYFTALQGMSGAKKKSAIEAMVEKFELQAFLKRPVETLSHGQRQRVMIARSMIHCPEVVILDEATVALDVLAARGLMEMMRDCRDEGKTVFFATHQMSEVNLLADDVYVLHRGKKLFGGSLELLKGRGEEGKGLEEVFIELLDDSAQSKGGKYV